MLSQSFQIRQYVRISEKWWLGEMLHIRNLKIYFICIELFVKNDNKSFSLSEKFVLTYMFCRVILIQV